MSWQIRGRDCNRLCIDRRGERPDEEWERTLSLPIAQAHLGTCHGSPVGCAEEDLQGMGEIVEREELLVLPVGDQRNRDLYQAGGLASPGVSPAKPRSTSSCVRAIPRTVTRSKRPRTSCPTRGCAILPAFPERTSRARAQLCSRFCPQPPSSSPALRRGQSNNQYSGKRTSCREPNRAVFVQPSAPKRSNQRSAYWEERRYSRCCSAIRAVA